MRSSPSFNVALRLPLLDNIDLPFPTERSSIPPLAPYPRDPYRAVASGSRVKPKPLLKLLTKDLRAGIVAEISDQQSSTCWQTRTGTMSRPGVAERTYLPTK